MAHPTEPIATPTGVLTSAEAAEFLRVQVDTLRVWRRERRGPRFVRLGTRVRYRLQDLEEFLQAQLVK